LPISSSDHAAFVKLRRHSHSKIEPKRVKTFVSVTAFVKQLIRFQRDGENVMTCACVCVCVYISSIVNYKVLGRFTNELHVRLPLAQMSFPQSTSILL
jgi:hypothetical protein